MKNKFAAVIQVLGLLFFVAIFIRNPNLVFLTWHSLQNIHWESLMFASLLFLIALILSSVRLQFFMKKYLALKMQTRVDFKSFFTNSLFLTLLNMLLITGAGDIYRIRFLSRFGISTLKSGWIALIDRFSGIVMILLFFLFSFVILDKMWNTSEFQTSSYTSYIASFFLILCSAIFMLSSLDKIRHKIKKLILVSVHTWLITILISLLSTIIWILGMFFVFKAIGIQSVGLVAVTFISCAVTLVTIIPVSIGGIGIREMGYIGLLSYFNVPADLAVSLGIIQYFAAIMALILGLPLLAVLSFMPIIQNIKFNR